MNKINKGSYYLTLVTSVIMISFTIMGILCFAQVYNHNHSVKAAQTESYTSTVGLIDSIVDEMHSAEGAVKPDLAKSSKSDCKKKKISLFIIYFATTFLISEGSIISLLVSFIGVGLIFKFTKYNILMRMVKPPPEIQFYRFWRLKFLDPLDKFIKVLSEKYDSNPSMICGLRSVIAK